MKSSILLITTTILLLAGCVYESPLTEKNTISIDPAVLGLWEPVPNDGEKADPNERMLVMNYSNTEYFIHHPVGKNGIYWRGYPIKIGGVSCVQLKALGTDEGPVPPSEKELFQVVSYRMSKGHLIVKTLNADLITNKLKGSDELKKAFLNHQDNENLFSDPSRFKKILSDN